MQSLTTTAFPDGDLPPIATSTAAETAPRTPTIGDQVIYVLADGRNKGEERPAIIVRIWSASTVNLQVFTDNYNDYPTDHKGSDGLIWKTSVLHDEAGTLGTWHWKA